MQARDGFSTEPLLAVLSVVSDAFLVLLEEPGVVHRAELTEEDGFGFLVEFGGERHGESSIGRSGS